MTTRRHRWAAVITASCLTLSACGGAVTETRPGDSVKPPKSVSAAFNQYAIWSTPADGSIRPVVSGDHVVYMMPTGTDVYMIGAINNDTGDNQWIGQPQEIPDSNEGNPIGLYAFTSGQRPYIAVVLPLPGEKAVRVDIYDPNRSGPGAAPIQVLEFRGRTAPPVVVVTSGGMIVNGVNDDEQHILDPATGTTKRFVGTLDRSVGGSKTTEKLWAAYGDATVTYWTNGGYTYRGTSGGWSSDNNRPDGTLQGTGTLLAADNGYVVSRWSGGFVKQEIIAVQDILTGTVLATFSHTTESAATPDQNAIAVARDGKWLTWKEYAFDIKGGSGREMVDEIVITAIADGIGYGTRRKAAVQFDIVTGGSGLLKGTIPRAFTDSGGVFTTTNDAKAKMFAAPFRNAS